MLLRLSNSKVVCGREVGREDAPGKWLRVFFGCTRMENPETASTRVAEEKGMFDIHCFDLFEIVYLNILTLNILTLNMLSFRGEW